MPQIFIPKSTYDAALRAGLDPGVIARASIEIKLRERLGQTQLPRGKPARR